MSWRTLSSRTPKPHISLWKGWVCHVYITPCCCVGSVDVFLLRQGGGVASDGLLQGLRRAATQQSGRCAMRASVQARTVQVLSEIVRQGEQAGLPVMAWSVSSRNVLSATCLGSTDSELRHAFEAWACFLGGMRRLEQLDPDGVLMLRALHDDLSGCRVLICADIHTGTAASVGGDRR